MRSSIYINSVFINCPFDTDYGALLEALIFAVYDCGFIARCSLETVDSGEVRINKIVKLIAKCKYGIHDISRTELDTRSKLPRFNMPLELGLFLGACAFGNGKQKKKVCLVLDKSRYRFQKFCSDISGQDISAHKGRPAKAIILVRDWLRSHTKDKIPTGQLIVRRYAQFRKSMPEMCRALKLDHRSIGYSDYITLVNLWLKENKSF